MTTPQLHIYRSADKIPAPFDWQIRSFLRTMGWYDAHEVDEPLVAPELNPTFFVLAEGDVLISYTRTIWTKIKHGRKTLKIYGLGDVFTYQDFRKQGYGAQIVKAATDYISRDKKAAAAILFTAPTLENFYGQSGWEHLPMAAVKDDGDLYDGFPMILFISEKSRPLLEEYPLILTGNEW